jgi:alpha-mannosidase
MVDVSVVKQAEDGDGLVVRAYETAGHAVDAVIEMPYLGRSPSIHFGPHEIKTLWIPANPDLPVQETNLLEDHDGPEA